MQSEELKRPLTDTDIKIGSEFTLAEDMSMSDQALHVGDVITVVGLTYDTFDIQVNGSKETTTLPFRQASRLKIQPE